MGREARVRARLGGREGQVRATLESEELRLRGDLPLTIPLRDVASAAAEDGVLRIETRDGAQLVLELGDEAPRWGHAMLNPPSLLDKLGIKDGMAVALVRIDAPWLVADLERRPTVRTVHDPSSADVVLLGAESVEELGALAPLREQVRPNAAVWVVRPKGPRGVPERAVMEAGARAGFVDVKVARFSATHTAEKFVIRLADR
jgi:hypothetical protein